MTKDKILDLDVEKDVASRFRKVSGGVPSCPHLFSRGHTRILPPPLHRLFRALATPLRHFDLISPSEYSF